MSVKVDHLVKAYGAQQAVNDITFEVATGQVLGFLGPNGAGKSTTMKIITCFLPPTAGAVTVCGFDIQKDPMEVRRRIGYLPESNPLYYDMYIKEYLAFVAGIHGLGGTARTKRIALMIEATGLQREQHKKIGQLSKGYKQRVGLAQAMIHDPEVLILDEPTAGLDPNQLVEIRGLIKSLGKQKTVILSTHIMQEVQAMCDRVIIINKGALVADDTAENLQQKVKGEEAIRVEFKEKVGRQQLMGLKGVKEVQSAGDAWLLKGITGADLREEVFRFAKDNNLTLLSLNKEQSSLEDVFHQLTNQ